MLGITVNDVVALGTMTLGFLAWFYGRKTGDDAKKTRTVETITSGVAGVFADKAIMERNAMALESIAGTLKEYVKIQTDQYEKRVLELLEQLSKKENHG